MPPIKGSKGQADETPDTGTGQGAELPGSALSEEIAAELAQATADTGVRLDGGIGKNVIAALYQSIHFAPTDGGKTYKNTDGTASKKIASIAMVYKGGHAAAAGNVYARGAKGKKTVVECTFAGTRGQSSMKPLTEQGKLDNTAFRLWMAEKYVWWIENQGVNLTASSRTTVTLPGASGMFDDDEEEQPAAPPAK